MRAKSLVAVVIGLALVAASAARAQIFTKNQILLAGSAPAAIPVSYDTGTSLVGTIPLGAPVHIVYGIQVTSSNASPNPVSLAITLPVAFTKTQIRCVRFAAGLNPGAPFTADCATPTSTIGALGMADDKVIVAIDGYFTQAGTFTANFAASRGTTTEPTSLNMDANTAQLPVDLEIIKLVKASTGGTFGSTATIPFGGTVTYQVTVKNLSAPDPAYHTSDVYLGPLLKIQDTISTPAANDVFLTINAGPFSPCTPTGGADCPALPTSALTSIGAGSARSLLGVNYPSTSNGFLPAGGSFTFTFDAVITTGNQCSPGQNNKLLNTASITYSNSTNTISDVDLTNNASTVTVTLTGLPAACPPPAPTLPMQKTLDPSTPAAWGSPLKYKITFTNNTSQTLTGLTLDDYVGGSGTPPFTAAFAAASVVCTPACIAPQPVNSAPYVTNSFLRLFALAFAPLPPNAVQTVEYTVQYDAVCSTSGSGGTITNLAFLNGPANGTASVSSTMPALPQCDITVTKTQAGGPTTFSSFPVTLAYKVLFKNSSPSQTVRIGTLVDAIAYESPAYAENIPVDYSYFCTASPAVTMPAGAVLSKTNVQADVLFNNPVHAGVQIFDFSSSPGAVFGPLGTLSCDVSVTLKQPPANDSKCPGTDPKSVVNTAFTDLYPRNYSSPAYKAPVATLLPKCVSILVGKTVSPNVFAGGSVTFTLTVKNAGNDPVSDVLLTDNVLADFTGVSWTCANGCTTASGSGNNISVALGPIAPGATTAIVVTATAPTVLGTYCNRADATFTPFPDGTFFEGDQAELTTASACVQVTSPSLGTGLTVEKKVEGAPPGFTGQFTFHVECTTPVGFYEKAVTVTWPAPGSVALGDVPPGSHCTVTEGVLPAPLPAGYSWDGLPIYTPGGGIVTTTDAGGRVTILNKLVAACAGKTPAFQDPVYAATFTGQVAVATCFASSPSDPVLVVIDLKNQTLAPLDTSWDSSSTPPTAFYHAPNWSKANLGNVFGLTLDNSGNIYLTATSSYANDFFGPAGPGGVYRVDAASGTMTTFATLGNTGASLGNIHYDATYDNFYVTNLDDGMIVRLSSTGATLGQWDHGANLPLNAAPAVAIPDDPSQLFTPLGRRVWGVHSLSGRLYYSVWWEDEGDPDPVHGNEVWSVALDGTGEFVPGSARLEVALPPLPSEVYSNPVSDINFGPAGNMLLAERSMGDLTTPSAHESRGLEYVLSGGAWTPSSNVFEISQAFPPGSSAGGVDQDFGLGRRVWFSGDALHLNAPDNIYGLQGLPATGGDTSNSILIDLNGDVASQNKTQIGDVAISCPAPPSEDVDVSLVTGFDEISGKRLARGTADDDWTVSVGGQPAQPARLVLNPPAAWPRFRPSDWISATASGASPAGAAPLRFERCFCVAADATNAKLTLNLWADDQATVLLNGTPIAGPGGQFRRTDPLSVLYMGPVGGSLFQPGNNCVAVEIDDLRPRYVGLDVAGKVWIDHGKCAGASY